MTAKLFIIFSCLLFVNHVGGEDNCNSNIIEAVDKFLHTNYHKIKLPQRTVLSIVTMKDGRVTDLGDIDWNVIETRKEKGNIILRTSGVLKSLNATYTCSVRIGSCSKANVHITDLTSNMDIKMDTKTGTVKILDISLNTGTYRLNGKLMGKPINLKDTIPNELKGALAKFIQNLANKCQIKADASKCKNVIY